LRINNLTLSIAATALGLLIAEGILRVFPEAAGKDYANGMLSRYSPYPDGVYWRWPGDRSVVNLMKPDYTTTMYGNGYRWTHQTDRRGFRNAVSRDRVDVILLGDSMIYGQGVEIDQTVGHYLEFRSGMTVANLARQGDCVYEHLRMLGSAGLPLRPRIAIHFFFLNDIRDLLYAHPLDDLELFLKAIEDGAPFSPLPEFPGKDVEPPSPPWSSVSFSSALSATGLARWK
jgi:hypothetical protein